MLVLLPLVALLAGAHALATSLTQKRWGGHEICDYIDVKCSLPNPHDGKPMDFGHLQFCVCLSGIPNLVKTDHKLQKAVAIFGYPAVEKYITELVKHKGKTCSCPEHGTLVCTKHDPCGFTCNDGYTPSDGKCVCKHPYKECNGKCGEFHHCPSKGPHKRDANEWKRHAQCDKGYSACGVLGRSKLIKEAYECVDGMNNLESCGGCTIPLHRGSPRGMDCTSLPGAADVSCKNGSCHVQKCAPGYQLALDNSMCLDDETVSKFAAISELGWERFAIGLN